MIDVLRVGREAQPVVVIDDFAPDPDALRTAALATPFGPAAHHYPGIRGDLPATHLADQLPKMAEAIAHILDGGATVIDASFSIVTSAPENLSVQQRLPHCDAFDRGRIALVHYLAQDNADGTAFFRHRSTGFEMVDRARSAIYLDQLDAELRHGGPPAPGYVTGDTTLFERVAVVEARYNRALIYPSWLLHSGAIGPDTDLSSDPATGRLTVTAFLSVGDEHG